MPAPFSRLKIAVAALLLAAPAARPAAFRTDVMAVLSKAGCNAGACHGNATGKGGFKLSLRGQDPAGDWTALTREQSGRRVNLEEPAKSLIVLKAIGGIAHEGGTRFTAGSPEYAILLDWLQNGGQDSPPGAPTLRELTVSPKESILVEPATSAQLTVTARFTDGSQRDVSRFAVYEPNNQGAKVTPEGLVTATQAGESTVLVRYLDKQAPVHFAFVPARPDFVWHEEPTANFIDEQIFRKLRTLRMNPSPLCSDEVFLRRVYLDLLGLIPTADEAKAFLADTAPGKRAALVDQLLERDEFADFWALKWSDLLKIEVRQLDQEGMRVFHDWIRASIKDHKPLDQFAREIVAARGSTFQNAPANWWRANRDPVTRAESTARVFLGTQLNCAQCHNHPFDRWTQDDYYNWAGVFSRIDYQLPADARTDKNDKHEFKGDQTVLIKASGFVLNPRTGEKATPRFLGGEKPKTGKDRDELLALADWLAASPMFARTQVNRIWYHLLGRGLVDPVDDFRASNPASHPALLEALAKDFTTHGYDLRRVIRAIVASRTYQLSSEPNSTNAGDEINFSHTIVRRLSAEQLIDSASAAMATPLEITGFKTGTRLAQIPEGKKHYQRSASEVDRFAASFGKPPRLIASDCERSNEIALPQAFQLISGPLIQGLLTQRANRLGQLLDAATPPPALVEQLYWHTLSRAPSAPETTRAAAYFAAAPDPRAAAEDFAWALLNSKEFLFRR